MNTLFTIFPNLPWTWLEITVNVVACLGAIMVVYAIFLEAEKRQDAVLAIGALCLMVYAIWIGNTIFSVAMGGMALASFIEFIEIMAGRHLHSTEMVEKYKHAEL